MLAFFKNFGLFWISSCLVLSCCDIAVTAAFFRETFALSVFNLVQLLACLDQLHVGSIFSSRLHHFYSELLLSYPAFTVAATGGASGNPVVFASATAQVCQVSGATVTMLAAMA